MLVYQRHMLQYLYHDLPSQSQAQKLVAQTQALAQLHCTIPRDASQLLKTQVPPVHVLHLSCRCHLDIVVITGWW